MALKINISDTWKYVDSAKINIGDVWKDVIFSVYPTVTLGLAGYYNCGYACQYYSTPQACIVCGTVYCVSGVTKTTANSGGLVVSDGYSPVTARGVCWSTNLDPTTGDTKTVDGTGTGVFTSVLSGLTAGFTYYIRAYATNSIGTAYSDNCMFMTLDNLKISGGNTHTLLAYTNNQTWSWGSNGVGALGDGNPAANRCVPVSVYGNKTFTKITAGNSNSLAIDKNGKAWGWGYNNYGQLGDNSVTSRLTPVSVYGNKTFCQIHTAVLGGATNRSFGIDKNGIAWGWGVNSQGYLGNNSTVSKNTPVSVFGNKTFCKIVTGYNHTVAIDKNGKVWTWGDNAFGQLGNNTITGQCVPVSILGANKTFCDIGAGYYHSVAIDKNGKAWGWGNNQYGMLGNYAVVSRRTPVSVFGAHTFCKIATGAYGSLAIDNNGRGWSWGRNQYGELGQNSTTSRCTPRSIFGNRTFCEIAAGSYHSLGVDNNNKTWAWGLNGAGCLGDNSVISKNSPVAVCGLI